MTYPLRCVVSAALIFALVTSSVSPSLAVTKLSRAEYEACQSKDEAGLQSAIAAVSASALKAGVKTVDYKSLVADQWRESGLDAVIDARVDIAVDEVRRETSWSELLQSLASAETSQRLATVVAERVYRSDAVKAAIETMAKGVADEIGESIEFVSADSTSPLLDCLKAFLGQRYGTAVAEAVAGDANRGLSLDPQAGSGQVSAGSVLNQSGGGIAGATILVVRRQLATLATRVGQRLVGSVLSRLVSVAAGGVGLVLIAKDVWELRNGVLPIIATEMKAKTTKEKVQEEIATSLSQQIDEHVVEISQASAAQVVEIWQSFKRAHALVLKIADGDAPFRAFLDGVKPEALVRLDEIVALVVAADGEAGVLRRLADGSLNVAVHQMPETGMTIARDSKSVGDALDWLTLAGGDLPVVVDLELHRRAKPSEFTATTFRRLLALGDRNAIQRLAATPPSAREALMALDGSQLTSLTKALSEDELTSLAGYLTGLPEMPRKIVLDAVAGDPTLMRTLASPRVRQSIIASADQKLAAEIMLRGGDAVAPRHFYGDAVAAWNGRVDPWIVWHKHPVGVGATALLGLLALVWLGRLFRRRPATGDESAARGAGTDDR